MSITLTFDVFIRLRIKSYNHFQTDKKIKFFKMVDPFTIIINITKRSYLLSI